MPASYQSYLPDQDMLLAREMGLVKLGTIAVDGTKIKANASRHKAMSYERMLKVEVELQAQIKAFMDKAQAADEAESNEAELDIPAEIARRQDRLAAIAEAKARLERRQRETDFERGRSADDDRRPPGKNGKPKSGKAYKRAFGVPVDQAQESFTDSDSRVMKRAGGGFDYSYNAQTAVDDMAHIVVAAELTNIAADSGELPAMLDAVRANLGRDAVQVLADAGYRSEAVFEQLSARPTELVVALGREGNEQLAIDSHKYPRTAAMALKLQTDEAKSAYRKRKWIAEPPNGWLKNVPGFRQFSMRGLHRVRAEFKLMCLALNLRRMCSMQRG